MLPRPGSHYGFTNGFTLWRDLGKTAQGELLSFATLTAIHWTHRLFAFVVVILVDWLALKALRIEGLRKNARWLLIMIILQFITGVSTIFLDLPLTLAVIHNGGAALLLLTMLNYKVRIAGRTEENPAGAE